MSKPKKAFSDDNDDEETEYEDVKEEQSILQKEIFSNEDNIDYDEEYDMRPAKRRKKKKRHEEELDSDPFSKEIKINFKVNMKLLILGTIIVLSFLIGIIIGKYVLSDVSAESGDIAESDSENVYKVFVCPDGSKVKSESECPSSEPEIVVEDSNDEYSDRTDESDATDYEPEDEKENLETETVSSSSSSFKNLDVYKNVDIEIINVKCWFNENLGDGAIKITQVDFKIKNTEKTTIKPDHLVFTPDTGSNEDYATESFLGINLIEPGQTKTFKMKIKEERDGHTTLVQSNTKSKLEIYDSKDRWMGYVDERFDYTEDACTDEP